MIDPRDRAALERATRDIKFARVGIAVGAELEAKRREGQMAVPTNGGRSVKRFVNLIEGLNTSLDKHVETTMASVLVPKHNQVKQAVTDLGAAIGKSFDDAAQHVGDMLNQFSNGEDDPSGSETESGGSAG